MILFDTDTLTHFSYGNETVRRRIEGAGDEPLAITVITRFEILRGRTENLVKAANEEDLHTAAGRLRRAEEVLSGFLLVSLEDSAIAQFGKLRRQKNLKKMGRPDMLIACMALANDAPLVTRNTKDYKDIAGLRAEIRGLTTGTGSDPSGCAFLDEIERF